MLDCISTKPAAKRTPHDARQDKLPPACQNRLQKLAQHRARLDLQEIIAILDVLRRDIPGMPPSTDQEATAMAQPADAKAVLAAIENAEDGSEKG